MRMEPTLGRTQGGFLFPNVQFGILLKIVPLQRTSGNNLGGCQIENIKLYSIRIPPSDTGHRLRVEPAGSGRGGWTGYYLNFTSQQWLTPELVSRSLWWHTLVVIVPDNLTTADTTIMWMTGNLEPLTPQSILF